MNNELAINGSDALLKPVSLEYLKSSVALHSWVEDRPAESTGFND